LVHAVSGDFAGDRRTDLLLLAAQDGPRLAVRVGDRFEIEGPGDWGANQLATRLAAAAAAGLVARDLIGHTFAGNFGGDARDDLLVVREGTPALLYVNAGDRFEPGDAGVVPREVVDALAARCAVVGEFLVDLE
ncbi:MAG: hypothetical protein KC466_09360, partial [Myxococcales bacterium]|nr:hypothetical protein [Myxococcales bacterium]